MDIGHVAVPFVYSLIIFLGIPSQILFRYLEPGPLTGRHTVVANIVFVLILITYTQAVFVDPGRIPRSKEQELADGDGKTETTEGERKRKWCRRCKAAKPPRAHHCKECKRCIPKMDHHCPWTANCVSHTTFPHFIRFLFYTNIGLFMLASLLWFRIHHIWINRHLPSYLGPSPFQMAHLFIASVATIITFFVLFILLVRNIWCLAVNTTTIEGWEIERHKTLVRRARVFGGWLEGPDGEKVRIEKQEFPYDIGIWKNIKQGMGTGNPLSWLNPFASTPTTTSGLTFETNGFESPSLSWPPPDPDRSYRKSTTRSLRPTEAFTYRDSTLSPSETIAAFKQRQADDVIRRRKPFLQRAEAKLASERKHEQRRSSSNGNDLPGKEDQMEDEEELGSDAEEDVDRYGGNEEQAGEEAWRNSEGERLMDFGVDEDVEFYDERRDDEDEDENVPLSELLKRKREERMDAPASTG